MPLRVVLLYHDPETGWSLRFFPGPGEAGDAPLHEVIRGIALMRPGEYLTIREPNQFGSTTALSPIATSPSAITSP